LTSLSADLAIEPVYVVDTNALIWYLTIDRKLSKQASAIFKAAEQGKTRLYLSAIVVAELYYANKKWGFFADFGQTYTEMKAKPYFRFVSFRSDHVLDFDQDAAVPEMHDRIVTGPAKKLGAPLLTSDPVITAAKIVNIIW